MKIRALKFALSGQDGCYLAKLLFAKGYAGDGIESRRPSFNIQRVGHTHEGAHIQKQNSAVRYGELADSSNLTRFCQACTSALPELAQAATQNADSCVYTPWCYVVTKLNACRITRLLRT